MALKVLLLTGATDGIGRHTVRLLARDQGAAFRLLIHGRDASRLAATRDSLLAESPWAQVETLCHDLSSFAGTRALADDVLTRTDRLDVLIQNAGVFMPERQLSTDGLEMTFTVNVAAPFILLDKLYPVLQNTEQSRVLMVSSISQSDGRFDLNAPVATDYDCYTAYGTSKLYMAMLAMELSSRVSAEDVVVLSCDPGTVNTKMLLAGWGRCGIPVDQADDEYNLIRNYDASKHGKYFVHCRERSYVSDVYDASKRSQLWSELERLTDTSFAPKKG